MHINVSNSIKVTKAFLALRRGAFCFPNSGLKKWQFLNSDCSHKDHVHTSRVCVERSKLKELEYKYIGPPEELCMKKSINRQNWYVITLTGHWLSSCLCSCRQYVPNVNAPFQSPFSYVDNFSVAVESLDFMFTSSFLPNVFISCWKQ